MVRVPQGWACLMCTDQILQSASHMFMFATSSALTSATFWFNITKNSWQHCNYRLYISYLFINHPFWQDSLRRCLLCMCWCWVLGSDVLMDALRRTVSSEPGNWTVNTEHQAKQQRPLTQHLKKSFSSIICSNSKHLSTPLNRGQINPWSTNTVAVASGLGLG